MNPWRWIQIKYLHLPFDEYWLHYEAEACCSRTNICPSILPISFEFLKCWLLPFLRFWFWRKNIRQRKSGKYC
ncbi:MAG: hypothetical protein ACD_2C00205G0001 [uncultured bacterium (gcode 4)]|uniref:Uncharacterized protein n=1 Tax=uncultured bacterium (gcode 4) TaxID=1234023 RepID=K2G204_9BACT|nr:MAG: hypothetical protein ACD_2C00205G0001 [uncultured bacterium (gcode 4)]